MTWAMLGVVATSLCYGVGTILQAVAARRVATITGLAPGMLMRLVREVPYLASLVLEGFGFLASVVALRTLPLFLVESAVASSVGVTAVIAVQVLGARLRAPELLALAGLALGLVLLAFTAEPGSGNALTGAGPWLLLVGAAVVAVAGVGLARLRGRWGAVGLAAAAGAGFGGLGISARVLQIPDPLWQLALSPIAWSLVAYGVTGMAFFAMSLQRGSVTATAAVAFSVETVLPAGIGLAFLGDAARPGLGAEAAVAFVLTLASAVALARFAEPEPGVAPTPIPQE
jgi:drug/metabolite transporter (DMT)-like permease